MSPLPNQTYKCPACGLAVKGTEHTCPQCGLDFADTFGFACPFCGDFIPNGSTKCPSCKLVIPGREPTTLEKLRQTMAEKPVSEPPKVVAKPAGKSGKFLACPSCHQLLLGSESKCPTCGRLIARVGELLCPICSSPVGTSLDKCRVCGALLGKGHLANKPPPRPVEVRRTPDQALDALLHEFESMVPCPKCGVLLNPGDSICKKCGAPLSIEAELEKDLAELSEADSVQDEDRNESRVTEALEKLGEIEKNATVERRIRKLKNEKVTTVAPKVRSSARGLSNGIGQINGNGLVNGTSKVNGIGRINGTGLTNGRSLVNGTGVSNGLKGSSKSAGGSRVAFLLRWQFMAVLVAVIVVISSLAAVSYLNKGGGYSADGNFGDWSKTPKFGAEIQSVSQTIDIKDWSVATEGNKLFFYVRSNGTILDSPVAQRYCLFVDTDGSSSTGYLLETVGAEYLLQVDGWNGTVQSASMFERSLGADQYDWSQWTSSGWFSAVAKGSELEAEATIPTGLGDQSRFVLLSKDANADGAVSYVASSEGGLLVVTQTPSATVADDGIVPSSSSTTVLELRFSAEGEGGRVESVSPTIEGAPLSTSIASFQLDKGQSRMFTVALDTSALADGQVVTAEILAANIESTFSSIEIVGERASAYVGASPGSVVIDGAFADWTGRTEPDSDSGSVANRNVDISDIGNVNTSGSSFFYVSVKGEMCAGTFIPANVAIPSGSGGGGGVVFPTRVTAEDVLRIFVDSDKSTSTGLQYTASSKTIGADHLIEVRGLHGRIVSSSESDYVSGNWVKTSSVVDAANDAKEIEIGVSSASLDGSTDVDFIIETTTWNGVGDTAAMTPAGARSLARAFSGGIGVEDWAVDGSTSGAYATAMSYQRKVFYDGTNYWSFYFDGKNTVHKYSTDNGVTWTRAGTMFKTSGVNETSVWYDSANNVVYAVGDTSTASKNVTLQKGTVSAATHNISWAASDSVLAVSSNDLAGKNSYISRDVSGYIWVLSSNCSQTQPVRFDLTAFKSTAVNSITGFAFSGQMLATSATLDNVKGSIVPAGSGGDVWAIYAYAGNVASRKYTGSWQTPQSSIYGGGGTSANTDNSPPSAVVDARGVVHVVWGTGRKSGQNSIPSINYAYNNTGATTFSSAVDLDAAIPADVGDYYPTISLDSSTNNLFVFWLRSDTSLVPQTVSARKYSGGVWSNLTLGMQTTYAKQYLTSIYSVSGEAKICWQWTQNTTGTYEVEFDVTIPEFSHVVLPVVFMVIVFTVNLTRSRRKKAQSLS